MKQDAGVSSETNPPLISLPGMTSAILQFQSAVDMDDSPEGNEHFGRKLIQRLLEMKPHGRMDLEKFVTDMEKELKKCSIHYPRDSYKEHSKKEVYKILKEIEVQLHIKLFTKKCEESRECESMMFSKNIEDTTKCTSGISKKATEKFIGILHTADEDDIIESLNVLLDIKEFNASHIVVVNRIAEIICNGESLLHTVFKFDRTQDFAKRFMTLYPHFLERDRRINDDDNDEFVGQTPLHVAIVKGNVEAVQETLITAAKNKMIKELLIKKSTGDKCKNTVLMGQLPLSVAALACKDNNFEIMTYLLDKGADIWEINLHGDTVFHSLIKYADIYPDKIFHIKASFKFLWKRVANTKTSCGGTNSENEIECTQTGKSKPKPTDIIFWKNKSGFTPLHLSAKLGVGQLFDFIINIKNVYRFSNVQDGLFDIRKYDFTEFDRLIHYKEISQHSNLKELTILESLFDSECTHQEAFQILDLKLVKFILREKWKAYKIPLFVWMIMHLTLMTFFTVSTMKRMEKCFQNKEIVCDNTEVSYAIVVMNILFGITYLTFSVVCFNKLVYRCFGGPEINISLVYHNLDYVFCLFAVSICLMMEAVLIILKIHWDYHLICAVLLGWYFMFYFTPFHKGLVSFTYMVKKGIFEDFLPFVLVFLLMLISFTVVMYMLFLGVDEVEEFDSFQNSLLTMFNLGVGLNNIDVLNKARIVWLAYTLFVLFAILSFIHLLNALIAVMTQTFSDVHTDKQSYLRYNRLRMIELFEDIVLVKKLIVCFPFLKNAKHWEIPANDRNMKTGKENLTGINNKQRFYTVLHSLNDQNDDIDDKEEKKNVKHENNVRESRESDEEQEKNMHENKLRELRESDQERVQNKLIHQGKKENRRRLDERYPAKEIIYVRVESMSKASQFPDVN